MKNHNVRTIVSQFILLQCQQSDTCISMEADCRHVIKKLMTNYFITA